MGDDGSFPDYIRPSVVRIMAGSGPISGKFSPTRTDYSFVAKVWRLWELETSDLELVRKAAKGDHQAFHALVDRHAKNLFRVALSLSATRADAEDLVQETYAGAFKSLARFDGRASVKTWLTRILMRRAADAWRSGRRSRGTARLEDDGGDSAQGGRPVGSPTVAVDRRLDVRTMLERLAPDHRQILILREMNGMSYAEIASALEIPQGTVESRLHRAREELRRRLGDYFR